MYKKAPEKGRTRMDETLILASGSPRRRELIGYMGIPFEVIVADAEETKQGGPRELVMENARRKAAAVAAQRPGRLVLGADTIVYLQGQVLGKPQTEQEAERMLAMLSGAWHTVYTGVCVMRDGYADVQAEESRVLFSALDAETIHRYVRTGEPMDKAGAYALQGRGGMFVEKIDGSYSNVIGLPMALTRKMLAAAGLKNF